MTTDQETLKTFISRRHPHYGEKAAHWDFLEETYEGGRKWFDKNIFRYMKEGDKEYADRVNRAYRFNHTRECVDLVNKYLFKVKPDRKEDDAPQALKDFWKKSTRSGLDIDQFMSTVASMSSKFGRIWVFVDTNAPAGAETRAEAKKNGTKIYAYAVRPQDVLDVGFDDNGEPTWILVREFVRDDFDPLHATGDVYERFRLWTQNSWHLFKEVEAGRRGKVVRKEAEGINPLGRLPCFPVDHILGDDYRYSSPALINDIAYLDRAVANYLSNLDAIIQDQTFSQLAMPAQGLTPGTEAYQQLVEMGTKRLFVYDGEGGVAPFYLSPDVKQAHLIVEVITKIIGEIYHTIGMAGERTKQDNAVGIDNSSGVAKAYDFERVNSLLVSKAHTLENGENMLSALVLDWAGESPSETDLVSYPDTFDVRSLHDEFSIAERLALVDAPDGVRREQMKQVIEKLFPRLKADLMAAMEKELKDWPPQMPEGMGLGGPAGSNGAPNASQENRQGQVTKDTDKDQADA